MRLYHQSLACHRHMRNGSPKAEAGNANRLMEPIAGGQAVMPRRLAVVMIGHTPKNQPTLRNWPKEVALLPLVDGARPLAPCEWPHHAMVERMTPGLPPADIVAMALTRLDADLVCFLDASDVLSSRALQLVMAAVARRPDLDIIFGDEDWLDGLGQRTNPFFKPGWNPELQRGRDLIGPCAFFRMDLVRTARIGTGLAWRYDLANQIVLASRPERIGHVPAVLCHRHPQPPGYSAALQAAAAEHLRRLGLQASVETISSAGGLHRVVYELPAVMPLVSVIVPTRDRPELLRVCADAVLQQTNYPHLELLIVDNGTTDPDAVALLDTLALDPRVTVIRHDCPFNWSELNNAGAARAAGDVILFLNNDVAVLQPDWLGELVAQVLQPDVGAVGAKLLYPDGSIQHAGLTTDALGFPRHLFRHAPGNQAGPSELMGLARDVWAVTGACMAMRREVFFAVGGLNEALPVTCNDVDFCLRLTANGYRLIWTPWAVLEHRELASRPPDHSTIRKQAAAEELDRLHRDWGVLVQSDPFLHPAFELIDEQPCFRLPASQ